MSQAASNGRELSGLFVPPVTGAIATQSDTALREDLRRCIRCAACLTSCPTYLVTQDESEGPRGRIALMSALLDHSLGPTSDVLSHLDNCLLCEACTRACPAGVEMESLGVRFRDLLRRNDRSRANWLRSLVVNWLFGDLGHFRAAATMLRLYQRLGLQRIAQHSGILSLLHLRSAERLLPPVPNRFVEADGREAGAGDPVQVFIGCIMSTVFASTTEATIRVLEAFGHRSSVTRRQVCCGALQLHSGDLASAQQLAQQNIAAFDNSTDEPIVANAAGCGAMLKHYGVLLPDDPRAAAFSARVRDVSELLAASSAKNPARPVHATVAIQDACHHIHAQRLAATPRQLLSVIPGLTLVEMAEPGVCCGSAGIYNLTHATKSTALQQRKCDDIVATGCDTVVTTNPGCLLQVRAGLPREIRVEHVVDLLDRAYGRPESPS